MIEHPADCEMRSVIRFLNARNIKPADIHRQLCEVYGDDAISDGMVRRWVRKFNEGRFSVHDEQHTGRPSLINDDLVRAVDEKIHEYRRFTISSLSLNFPQMLRSGSQAGEFYNEGIERLVPRLDKCLNNGGDYGVLPFGLRTFIPLLLCRQNLVSKNRVDHEQTSKWADNREATNFECTLTPCDLNCGFLLTNSDVYYANQDFQGCEVASREELVRLVTDGQSSVVETCDNALWGSIKSIVAQEWYGTIDEVHICGVTITPAMLRRMSHRIWRRIILCEKNDRDIGAGDGASRSVEILGSIGLCAWQRSTEDTLLTVAVTVEIFLRRLAPYVDEIIGDHQSGFRRNRSTIDQIFCIRQIMEKKWEYKDTVHQLFIDFKKAYDSVKREVLYDILIEFGIPKKLVRLIKMCLSETCSRVRIGQFLSDAFPIHCGIKQRDALSPLIFNFALEYAIRKVQDNRQVLELNGLHQFLDYADDVNMLGENTHTIRENTGILLEASKAIGLEVNPEKTKYMIMSRDQNIVRNGNIKIGDLSFEEVEKLKYLGATVTNINDTREEIKRRINMGNACYYSVEKLLSSSLLSKNLKVRIYKTVILPVLLDDCETWTLTLREEHRLSVFENKVLRKIFGAKRDEVTG
ncbi:hypothetical protein ANN_05590 [Periplaneta americana]|uniref:Reverse transcriptase domain-containing protein n=1 Tax=Periplaneta americana TaxID=6978 RepID=A0ABQ8TD23_PERAM|nr:hypothetical protein ANN_05590 [Periplaneta americana]